jgi:RimJ/RimL family protein N-acetyltransferase
MIFTMREAHEDDAAFIRQLFTMPHVREFLNAPSREMIVAGMENPNSEVYVIEADGEPAGNLVLHHHGFLVDIGLVVAAYQRRGIGSFALRWALHRSFSELHAHRVFLEVREDNAGTRRLVERLGFIQEGVYRDGYQDQRTGEFKNLCPYGILEDEYDEAGTV